jgi:hypothetical protein
LAKSPSEFQPAAGYRDGLKRWCKSCVLENKAKWRANNADREREAERRRYAAKPELGRAKSKRFRDGHREAIAEYQRRYFAEEIDRRPDHVKKRRLRNQLRKYGLTPEQFAEMLEAQDGRCAICGDTQATTKKRFHVDHCHATGRVRGLLCSRCNPAIGLFKEDPDILNKAIAYLQRELYP